jgi:hypothetical protein
MGIAEEIALVEREFISGELLVVALIQQERVSESEVIRWLRRNIEKLGAVTALTFNRELRDFRFADGYPADILGDEGNARDTDLDWEADQGYICGWLTSDLKSFFSKTNVDFPELAIRDILQGTKPPDPAPKETIVTTVEVDDGKLGTRERNTLLTIIAAISGEAKIPIVYPSKSAEFIAGLTQLMGSPVSKRSIEDHLKKIPGALEARSK